MCRYYISYVIATPIQIIQLFLLTLQTILEYGTIRIKEELKFISNLTQAYNANDDNKQIL